MRLLKGKHSFIRDGLLSISKLTFLLLLSQYTNGQLLKINQPLFSDDPFFNSQFIKVNKIKSITGSRSSKKIQDIIRSKGLDFYYEFDENGYLTKQIATFLVGGIIKDTNIISYEYNNSGHLTLKRKSDNYGFYSYHYLLDSLNRIIKQTYNREENTYACKGNFKLCQQYKISSDSFSYQKLNDTQVNKLFYNNYGKIFKQQTNYYDEFGYLIEEYTKFIIGNKKSRKKYYYDENGRLIKQDHLSHITKGKMITTSYEYDDIGNILYIKIYHNTQHITTKQFLYDKKTMLLTAQLIQDIASEFIEIIQYQYTFFDGINNY